jgi:hypothetical protein
MTHDRRLEHSAQLSGKVLRRSENQGDTGYFWEKSVAIFLYDDSSFRYIDRRSGSVSGGGLSRPFDKEVVAEGRWTVETRGFAFHLVLEQGGVEAMSWRSENRGVSLHYLDDEAWDRYLIA